MEHSHLFYDEKLNMNIELEFDEHQLFEAMTEEIDDDIQDIEFN